MFEIYILYIITFNIENKYFDYFLLTLFDYKLCCNKVRQIKQLKNHNKQSNKNFYFNLH